MERDNELTEQQSLLLIQQMISTARNSYHGSGINPIMWGSIIAICSIVTYLRIEFDFRLPFDIWWLTIVALILQVFLAIRAGRKSKVKSYKEEALDFTWLGFGICIFLLVHVNINASNAIHEFIRAYETAGGTGSFSYSSFTSAHFLILYGLPTFITGGIMKFKPMLWGGVLCWVCSIICAYTNLKADMLLTAVSAIFAWLIPGIILMKSRKRRAANV